MDPRLTFLYKFKLCTEHNISQKYKLMFSILFDTGNIVYLSYI